MVDLWIRGKRYRHPVTDIGAGRAWVDQRLAENALELQPSTPAEIHDASRARALLPAGVTLVDAARAYLDAHPSGSTATLTDVYKAFMADKASAGLRGRSLENLRCTCGSLVEDLGSRRIADISTADLTSWMADKNWSPVTRGNHRRAWCGLWRWARRAGYLSRIVPEGLTSPAADDAVPGILTPAQGIAMLTAAIKTAKDLVAYLAVGMFAGLRSSELSSIEWGDISDTHIRVVPSVAKARRQRLVPVSANLRAILAARRGSGRIAPFCRRQAAAKLARCAKKAGIESWPHNALRHSYASYHLALGKNAAETAHNMGHTTGSCVLWEHYRSLVSESDGIAWFQIGVDGLLTVSAPKGPTTTNNQPTATDSGEGVVKAQKRPVMREKPHEQAS